MGILRAMICDVSEAGFLQERKDAGGVGIGLDWDAKLGGAAAREKDSDLRVGGWR